MQGGEGEQAHTLDFDVTLRGDKEEDMGQDAECGHEKTGGCDGKCQVKEKKYISTFIAPGYQSKQK